MDQTKSRRFVAIEVERDEERKDMFVMLKEEACGDLNISLTNCLNAWTCVIGKDEKPRVASDKDKTLVDLVKRYLGTSEGSKGKYKMKVVNGDLSFVIDFNNFMLANMKLKEAQLASVMQAMLADLLKRDQAYIRLQAKEREMKETIDQLNATIEQRVDTEIRIQDELALQFLQVLNRKKDYNAKLEQELEALKAAKGEDLGARAGVRSDGKEADDESRPLKKQKQQGKSGRKPLVLSDIEEDEEEEDAMFNQFHA